MGLDGKDKKPNGITLLNDDGSGYVRNHLISSGKGYTYSALQRKFNVDDALAATRLQTTATTCNYL